MARAGWRLPVKLLRRDSRNGSLQAGGPAAGKRVRAAVAASLFPLEEVAPGVCVWPLAQRTVGRGKSARGARGGDRAHHLLQRPEARAGACVAGRQNPIPETDGLLISGVDRQLSDKLLGCWHDANGDNRPPGITRRPVLSQLRLMAARREQ